MAGKNKNKNKSAAPQQQNQSTPADSEGASAETSPFNGGAGRDPRDPIPQDEINDTTVASANGKCKFQSLPARF